MAIYDHQYGDLSYYRVFRAWGGKEYQEYVRIKRSRETALKKAQEIDARLAKAQRAFAIEQTMTPEYHFRSNGQIRGLRRVWVSRKGRAPSEVFELRINVPWEEEIRRTTISISVHGEQQAYQQAIDKICEWYGLKLKSELGQKLLAAISAYPEHPSKAAPKIKESAAVTEIVFKKAKNEISSLTDGLFKGLKRFTA